MALDRSVHVPTLAPKPSRSVPRKTPKDSRKTTRPVQNESQSSLILALGCVIGLYLPVNPVAHQPFSPFQARSRAYWELPIREHLAGTRIWRVRRQSAAATALWLSVPDKPGSALIQSGVALRLPPHSIKRWLRARWYRQDAPRDRKGVGSGEGRER